MTIATISERGLLAVAILVAVLWGCWLGQRHYLSQARQNIRGAAQNIRALHRMTPRTAPALSFGRLLTSRTAVI